MVAPRRMLGSKQTSTCACMWESNLSDHCIVLYKTMPLSKQIRGPQKAVLLERALVITPNLRVCHLRKPTCTLSSGVKEKSASTGVLYVLCTLLLYWSKTRSVELASCPGWSKRQGSASQCIDSALYCDQGPCMSTVQSSSTDPCPKDCQGA